MRTNTEYISQNNIYDDEFHKEENPDILEQMDKIINKYKTQLKYLKLEKNFPGTIVHSKSFFERKHDFPETKSNLTNEIQNDNMKLDSALTLEKSKVVKLLSLLKINENENKNLKQQIDNLETKINEIEGKYQNIINQIQNDHSIEVNNMINNFDAEKNKLKDDYEQVIKNYEKKIEQLNMDLDKKNITINSFFDLFKKNINFLSKADIISLNDRAFLDNNNCSSEKAVIIVEKFDEFIQKLIKDNQDLYNEVGKLNCEKNNNKSLISENNELKSIIDNLTKENISLKKSLSYKYNNQKYMNTSLCKNCVANCLQNNDTNVSPFDQIKIKINNLEKKIKNKTFS